MKNKIALIMAHPDDAEIWSGGTLLNHAKKGDDIWIHYCYCDEKIRQTEALLSAKKINAKITFSSETDENSSLIQLVAKFRPSIMITHWEGDTHPEHLDVFNMILRIVPVLSIENKIQFNLYSCDCYNSLGRNCNYNFMPTDYIDITDVWGEKVELISSYRSQPINYWKNMIELQNRFHGARVGVKFSEAFVQVPLLGVSKRSVNLLKGYT